jgi:hypothetical protein
MSDIAASIECALDDGFTYEEIIQGLMNEYTCLDRESARQLIDGVVHIIDECERAAEIAAEASFN